MCDPARDDDIGLVLRHGGGRIQLFYIFAVGDRRLADLRIVGPELRILLLTVVSGRDGQ